MGSTGVAENLEETTSTLSTLAAQLDDFCAALSERQRVLLDAMLSTAVADDEAGTAEQLDLLRATLDNAGQRRLDDLVRDARGTAPGDVQGYGLALIGLKRLALATVLAASFAGASIPAGGGVSLAAPLDQPSFAGGTGAIDGNGGTRGTLFGTGGNGATGGSGGTSGGLFGAGGGGTGSTGGAGGAGGAGGNAGNAGINGPGAAGPTR